MKQPFKVPPGFRHLAVIMDGNGRWATRRGLPRVAGHRAGAESVRRLVRLSVKIGLPYLTLYALSTENLERPRFELNALMEMLRQYLAQELPEFIRQGIRLRIIGDPRQLPADLRAQLKEAIRRTAPGKSLTLCIALAYGGREEIVRAAAKLGAGGARPSEAAFARGLDTAGIPDPDLLVRTGGELRLSNFLLWQTAYTELYFTRALWPDFRGRHLRQALAAFARRERRFGRVTAPASPRS
jgi:undecaprenyl diphosphate synthase